LQHLPEQSGGGGTDAGLDSGLDWEAFAVEGERRQERSREGLGTLFPGGKIVRRQLVEKLWPNDQFPLQ